MKGTPRTQQWTEAVEASLAGSDVRGGSASREWILANLDEVLGFEHCRRRRLSVTSLYLVPIVSSPCTLIFHPLHLPFRVARYLQLATIPAATPAPRPTTIPLHADRVQ